MKNKKRGEIGQIWVSKDLIKYLSQIKLDRGFKNLEEAIWSFIKHE